MPRPHIQVIMGDATIPRGLRDAIGQTGASASFRPLGDVLRLGQAPVADAVVIVVPDDMGDVARSLRVLLERLADRPRAVLVLKAAGGAVPRVPHPRTVPVTFGCGLGADELGARLATMLAMRDPLEALHGGMLANRESEETATRRFNGQLRLASQVQRELISDTLPAFGPVSFSAVFRPAEYVSGDIYDVHRLDEENLAVAVADATGHGIPAALLTVFIKRALRGKEIENGRYRILRPDEVLTRLNEELLDADLSDCSFVALTYAVLNTRTLTVTLARAGSPYPLVRRSSGQLELLRPSGGVVGVMPDARFAVRRIQLEPGDALLICSDGLDGVAIPHSAAHDVAGVFTRVAEEARVGCEESLQPAFAVAGVALADGGDDCGSVATQTAVLPARIAPGEALLTSPWCKTLQQAGVDAALDQLAVRHDALRRLGHPLDDLTVLAMHVRE